ncbi:MAG: hypothetical protein AAF447_02160, partial [Myxococcota bacterium]
MSELDPLTSWLLQEGAEVYIDGSEERPWTEVLVAVGDERWLGRGPSRQSALRDVVRQMAPSALTLRLVDAAIGAPAVAAAPAPAVAPAAATAGPIVTPRRRGVVAREVPDPNGDEARAAIESLDELHAQIDATAEDLGLMAPSRIRLFLLAWIAEARTIQDEFGGLFEVSERVGRVAGRLGELAKSLWPGSVPALRLESSPREAFQGVLDAPAVRSWGVVAARVRHHLTPLVDDPHDDDGWGDGAVVYWDLPDAEARLAELVRETDALLAERNDEPDLDAIAGLLARFRALRHSTTDGASWGLAVGQLRRRAWRHRQHTALRIVLDEEARPSGGWDAWAKRRGPSAPSETADSPPEGLRDDPEALWTWLREAIDAHGGPELRAALEGWEDEVAAIDADALPNRDRRYRRRLRDLQRRVASAVDDEGDLEDDDEADLDEAPRAAASTSISVPDALRARLAGCNALFVSNRADPELKDALEEVFG